MVEYILASETIDAGADGGLSHGEGTFGFVFGDGLARSILAEGNGAVPGGASPTSSTRSELCGIFACLSYLRLIM